MSIDNRTLSNVEPAYNMYLHKRSAALGVPLAGNFELTTRCNFNCKMCYVHDNTHNLELSAKEWIEIGRQAAENGMVFLLLTGGEPLLRKDFRQIYSELKKMGLLISINTNGSLIDDEMFEFLAENPPMRINVSLYGASDETYRKLCGQPVFDRVKNNIIRMHEAGIQVKLNGSITPYNEGDIEKLYDIAEEIGVPLKATSYMFPPVRVNGCQYGEAPHRFTAKEAAMAQLRCQEQYLTPEQLAGSFNPQDVPETDCMEAMPVPMHCRAGKSAFWLTWDGRMLPCGMMPVEGYSVKEYGFRNAWEAVRGDCKNMSEPAECAGCPKRKQCPSCVASCIAEAGETAKRPEYICQMVQYLDKLKKEKYL